MPRLVASVAGWIAGAGFAALLLRAIEQVLFGFDILSEEDWERLFALVSSGNYTFLASWRSVTWPIVSIGGMLLAAAAAFGAGKCASLLHDRMIEIAAEKPQAEPVQRPRAWEARHPRLHVFLAALGLADRRAGRRQAQPLARRRARKAIEFLPTNDVAEKPSEARIEPPSSATPVAAAAAAMGDVRSRPPRPWSRRRNASETETETSQEKPDEMDAAQDHAQARESEPTADEPIIPPPDVGGIEDGIVAGAARTDEVLDHHDLVAACAAVLELAAEMDHPELEHEAYLEELSAELELRTSALAGRDASCLDFVRRGLAGSATLPPFGRVLEEAIARVRSTLGALPDRPPTTEDALGAIWIDATRRDEGLAVDAGETETAPQSADVAAKEPGPVFENPMDPDRRGGGDGDLGEREAAEIARMIEEDWGHHRRLEPEDLDPPSVGATDDIDPDPISAVGPGEAPVGDLRQPPLPVQKPAETRQEIEARSGRGRRSTVGLVAGELARGGWSVFTDVCLGETLDTEPADPYDVADLVALSADRLVIVVVSGLTGRIEAGDEIWRDDDGPAFSPLKRARTLLDEAEANLGQLAALRRHRREAVVVLDACRPDRSIVSEDGQVLVAQLRDGAVAGQWLPSTLEVLGGEPERIHGSSEAVAALAEREETLLLQDR